MPAALVATALALVMHNSSVGTHRFVVHSDGDVDVEVALHHDDAFDLCAITPTETAADLAALRGCFARTLPARLRLSVDDVPCPLRMDALNLNHETVTLVATATCPAEQRWWTAASLVIDWGLFAGTGRAHVSTGGVVLPGFFRGDAVSLQTRLATDTPKLAIALQPRLPGVLCLGGGVIVLAAAARRWWRRRRTGP